MKVFKIFISLGASFLPCLCYNPSGVVSVGHDMAQVIEKSYISMIADIPEITGMGNTRRTDS
jgi:hypothetical protein